MPCPGGPAERLRLGLDLYQAGEDLMRQNLTRRHPQATSAEIQSLLQAWLLSRPGAEHGDAAGRPVAWPRQRR